MAYKWRVLCTIHGWQYGWSDTELTACPLVSTDLLVPGRVYIVGEEVPVMIINPITTKTNAINYSKMASIVYNGNHWGPLTRVKICSNMDNGITSYDVELFNRDSHTSIITANFTNTGISQESDLGLLPTPIENIVTLEINMKRNGGIKNNYVNIEQIIFYTRKEQQ